MKEQLQQDIVYYIMRIQKYYSNEKVFEMTHKHFRDKLSPASITDIVTQVLCNLGKIEKELCTKFNK